MPLNRAAHFFRERHHRARDAALAAGERGPIIRESWILAIHDNGNLLNVDEPHLPPQLRLTVWPEVPTPRPHGSQRGQAGVEHGTRVKDEVEGGHTPKKLVNTGCDHTARTGHSLHLRDDLFSLRDDVQGQRGNRGVECATQLPGDR